MGPTRVFVGNLPFDTIERDIDDAFYRYGRILDINLVKERGHAFLEFSHPRDADDAVHYMDGRDVRGRRIKVEFAKSGGRPRRSARDGSSKAAPKSEHRVLLSNLPQRCSWQNLKDFLRKAGDVTFTKTAPNGTGAAEFSNEEDMNRAIAELNGQEFEGMRVVIEKDHNAPAAYEASRSRSRSNSRERSRGRDRPQRGRGRRSRSRSRSRDRRRRSRSRSPSYRRSPSYDRRGNSVERRGNSPDRERYRERSRERGYERRSRGRSPSRSPSRTRRSRSDSRNRSRSPPRNERSRSRSNSRNRAERRSPEREHRADDSRQ